MNILRIARHAAPLLKALAKAGAPLLNLVFHPKGIERNGALVLCIPGAPIVRLR